MVTSAFLTRSLVTPVWLLQDHTLSSRGGLEHFLPPLPPVTELDPAHNPWKNPKQAPSPRYNHSSVTYLPTWHTGVLKYARRFLSIISKRHLNTKSYTASRWSVNKGGSISNLLLNSSFFMRTKNTRRDKSLLDIINQEWKLRKWTGDFQIRKAQTRHICP